MEMNLETFIDNVGKDKLVAFLSEELRKSQSDFFWQKIKLENERKLSANLFAEYLKKVITRKTTKGEELDGNAIDEALETFIKQQTEVVPF